MADKKKKTPDKKTKTRKDAFPVVCLGASAGGLKALETFFAGFPEKSGISFVAVTHTDPDRATLLPDILKRKAKVPVKIIEDGTAPEQNTLHLPPSNKDVVIEGGRFQLKEREKRDGLHMPIDVFLESLAREYGEFSGCAILSGTGTDGTHGLRLIKEAGGVTAAEAKSSADHHGMPQSAIDTGLVDFISEPDRMTGQLIDYFKHPATLKDALKGREEDAQGDKRVPEALRKIIHLLATRTRHDFSQYKKSTLIRRIERRMTVTRSKTADEYLDYLRSRTEESEALFQDLLIGVTEFFRDAETFAHLKETVLPDLFTRLDDDDTLRAWIAGCTTGEEVYSVAVMLREYMDAHKIGCGMQLFGTDIDKHAVEKAREGLYLPNIAAKVSPERLERFFVKEGNRFRVKKEIREPVIFAVQDILRDPPFTSLDLLFCRNLLIYLEAEAQKKLIPLFHYSLKPKGALVLGSSETVGRFGEYFKPLNKKHIYIKKETPPGTYPQVEFPTGGKIPEETFRPAHPAAEDKKPQEFSGVARAAERLLLERHTPTCVIVDADGRLLHVHGRTGKYLEIPAGKPDLELTGLAREGLRVALSSALRKAAATKKEDRRHRIRVKTNSEFEEIDLSVTPLDEPAALNGTFMVVFKKSAERTGKPVDKKESGDDTDDEAGRIAELEQELIRVREDYRGVVVELETSNEELKAVNEEMHSSNEELQSTNEELESSREELQSLNEALNTVNNQLQNNNDELADAYGSITDVLSSTKIAVLFLDNDLCVKRFTPEAAALINLVDHDTGRPIGHISHNLDVENLTQRIREVMDSLRPFEDDVRTNDGHWYRLRIMVHRTKENVLEGAVITFVNIDAQKQAQAALAQFKEEEINAERRFSDSIVDTIRQPLLVLDKDFIVLSANRPFYDTFQTDKENVEGKSLFEMGNGQWDIPKLRTLLDKIVTKNEAFEDYRVEHDFPDIGKRRMLLNARRLKDNGDQRGREVLLTIDDITDRSQKGDG